MKALRFMGHRVAFFRLLIHLSLMSALCVYILNCSAPKAKNYYLLQYPLPELQMSSAKFPIVLRVSPPRINTIFDRLPIVYRYSMQKLQYYNYHLWAVKPEQMISDVLVQHLRRTGLFSRVSASIEEQLPDYTIHTELVSIEELDSVNVWYAHLAMNFALIRESDGVTVATHSFDRKEAVEVQTPAVIVQALSGILDEEVSRMIVIFDEFLSQEADVEPSAHLIAKPKSVQEKIAEIVSDTDKKENNRDTFESTWKSPPIEVQLAQTTKQIPTGKGAIFVPIMTEAIREPLFEIKQPGGFSMSGQVGSYILLDPGQYTLKIGSGLGSFRVEQNVEVKEGELSIVKPTWAGMSVRVVDEQNVAFRGSYELIYMASREAVGVGFGVDEETGEQPQTWILKPGFYKIIKIGENYRARKDFATVELKAGVLTHFVLVLDPTTESFLGAGIFEPDIEMSALGNWHFNMTFGGNFSLDHFDNVAGSTTEREGGSEISASLFLDNIVTYNNENHFFKTRIEIEEGQTRLSGSDRFTKDFDELDLDSIYIYRYMPRLGPYARFGLDTNLFPTRRYFNVPVEVQNAEGTTIDTLTPQTDPETDLAEVLVELAQPFSFLSLKEGTGINVTLVKRTFAEFNTRFGFGARQLFTYDFFNIIESNEESAIIRSVDDNFIEGIEGAVVGNFRLSRWVLVTTDFEILAPFDDFASPILTWQNSVGFRLARYASLNYITKFVRDPEINSPEDPLSLEQRLLFRLSFDIL